MVQPPLVSSPPEPFSQLAPAPPGGPPPTAVGTLEPPPPPPPGAGAAPGGVAPVVFAVLIGVWTVAVAVGSQTLTWLVEQVLVLSGVDGLPRWGWPVAAWVGAILIAVPALLLAVAPRPERRGVRAAGKAWLLGALALGVLGSIRAVPVLHHELYLALLAAAATALAIVLGRVTTARQHIASGLPTRDPAATLVGLAAGLACLLPWLWLGSLGGVLETLLALAAALAVGALAGAVVNPRFWAATRSRSTGRTFVLGGLVAGVAFVPIAAGVGATGVHLASLLVVPPLGFAAAALQGRRWPTRCLVAAAAFGPLAFVDPEETWLVLNLNSRDAGFWAGLAALAALVVALLGGVALLTVAGRPPRRALAAASTAIVLVAGIGVYGFAGQPGLHGDRLFVVLSEQADLTGIASIVDRSARLTETYRRLVEHADRSQAGLRKELARLRLRYTPYYLVNGVEVTGGPEVRAWLSRRDDVDRVLVSPRLRPLPAAAPSARDPRPAPNDLQWNIEAVHADRVWREFGVTGRDIVVGGSDSGVDGAHPTLRQGFRGGDDSWYDPWNASRTPLDHNGHGTHTMGSAVGRAPNGAVPGRDPGEVPAQTTPAIGVAPGAQWVGCVNLDRNLSNPARYLDCLQFMLAPFPYAGDPLRDGRPARAPHILTNSWGCPDLEGCDTAALRPATAALAAAGIFVVVAAGNSGVTGCGSVTDPPAPYPDVLTVGAVDERGLVADFSSRGPTADGLSKPDIVAPGDNVLSAFPGGTYAALPGTSMATPHVAGVVALMWSANPRLVGDITRTRRILADTAKPPLPSFGSAGTDACGTPADVYGSGVVDAFAAVRAARELR